MFDYTLALQAEFPVFIAVLVFIVGSMIGSFLNVVIYRVPIMLFRDWEQQAVEILGERLGEEDQLVSDLKARFPRPTDRFNLFVPNSRCPSCSTEIKPWHNIPILGWLMIGGKCASCAAPISRRYPIIETVTAVLTTAVIVKFGLGPEGLSLSLLTWALIALAMIDYDTQLLPDDITLLFMWIGMAVNFFDVNTSFVDAFLGAALGYLTLWSVYHLFKLITGKEGMGYGDFKMLAMLGAWLGAHMLPMIILLSSAAGAVIGGAMIAFGRDSAKPIKFGPFLAVAGWIALMWGSAIIEWYFAMTGPVVVS